MSYLLPESMYNSKPDRRSVRNLRQEPKSDRLLGSAVPHVPRKRRAGPFYLCARCGSRVLVCRRCDRGQIYCAGTCAQQARRHRQREARRRYQATPRGRAMHAARSRRYRARGRCVTDHGSANQQKADSFLELQVSEALREPSHDRKSPPQWLCHHCRRSASEFVRLLALRPRRSRRKKGQIGPKCYQRR